MRTKLLLLLLIAAVSSLGLSSLAFSKTPRPLKFSAALNIGQERPHATGTKVGASGRFTATLTGTTLKWTLTFTHLSGPAISSHIHKGARGVNGAILIPLCPSSCTSPLSGTTTLTQVEITDMKARKMYVNVHTAKNPGGEIRGQITSAV